MTLFNNPDKDRLEYIFGIVSRTKDNLEICEQIACVMVPHQFHGSEIVPRQGRSQHIIRQILVQNVVPASIR